MVMVALRQPGLPFPFLARAALLPADILELYGLAKHCLPTGASGSESSWSIPPIT